MGDPIDLQERSMSANGVIVRKRFRRSMAGARLLLSGAVDSRAQESEAVKVASQINGVVSVTDNMSVKVKQ
jgi:hypothetical protein